MITHPTSFFYLLKYERQTAKQKEEKVLICMPFFLSPSSSLTRVPAPTLLAFFILSNILSFSRSFIPFFLSSSFSFSTTYFICISLQSLVSSTYFIHILNSSFLTSQTTTVLSTNNKT